MHFQIQICMFSVSMARGRLKWKLPLSQLFLIRVFPFLLTSAAASLSVLSQLLQSCPTLCDLQTIAHQAPLSMGFSRQEDWSGLPYPLPGDLPNPGIKPISLAFPALLADSLPTEPPGKPISTLRPPKPVPTSSWYQNVEKRTHRPVFWLPSLGT